jgi:signal transduction histidine kinase
MTRVATMGQLATSIADELSQPITAVVTNASAGLLWLAAQPPDLEEVRDAFDRVIKAGNQAGQVIGPSHRPKSSVQVITLRSSVRPWSTRMTSTEELSKRFHQIKDGRMAPIEAGVRAFRLWKVAPMRKPEEQEYILLNVPPSRVQRQLALMVVVVLLLLAPLITVGPLSNVQLPQIEAFVPAYAAAMLVSDLITAVLLFAQFSVLRSLAVLAISIGYLFTALIIIPWLLTFPNVFAPDGLLGAGLQTTVWLYSLWHLGFPMFVIIYALLKDPDPAKRLWRRSAVAGILWSITLTVAFVSAATFLVIAGDALLPRLMIDPVHFSILWDYTAGFIILLSILAIIALWVRQSSLIDLWLMVVMWAYATEVYVVCFPIAMRYSIGWYAGRVCSLFSGSLILCVLLYEMTLLYARLVSAVRAQRREREARLGTGDAVAATIAHEVKQPLTAMITRSETGLRWLDRSLPDLDKAKAQFIKIAADGRRAGAVIESIRANFRKDARSTILIDVNDLIAEALALTRDDLQSHRITIKAEPNGQRPQIVGDRTQLQQVLLNLITNAIDAMAAKDGPRVLRVGSELRDDGGVVVSVADTGTGISSQDSERIFSPLFTTKSGGMGMGLSICRSIIEAHGGQLWVAPNTPVGAVFQFVVGADAATPVGAS